MATDALISPKLGSREEVCRYLIWNQVASRIDSCHELRVTPGGLPGWPRRVFSNSSAAIRPGGGRSITALSTQQSRCTQGGFARAPDACKFRRSSVTGTIGPPSSPSPAPWSDQHKHRIPARTKTRAVPWTRPPGVARALWHAWRKGTTRSIQRIGTTHDQ